MESVEFQKAVTELTKDLNDVERSLARSTLQSILIGQVSVVPTGLDKVLAEFRKCLEAGER